MRAMVHYSPLAHNGSYAKVAQSVEHSTENAGVGGSIPPLGTLIYPLNKSGSHRVMAPAFVCFLSAPIRLPPLV